MWHRDIKWADALGKKMENDAKRLAQLRVARNHLGQKKKQKTSTFEAQ